MLCFLGELYRDLEQPEEAIDALDRAIRLHEIVCETNPQQAAATQFVSGCLTVGIDQLTLERTSTMKTLAEEQIKAGNI